MNERALKSHLFHRSSKCKQFLSRISHQDEQENMSHTSNIMDNAQCFVTTPQKIQGDNDSEISMETRFEILTGYVFLFKQNHNSFDGEEYAELFTRSNGHTGIYSESQNNFYKKIQLEDTYAEERANNSFWPFSCFMEWEVAQFLENIGISQEKKDEFLRLKYVCH
jgi:hypothetical protein